MTQKKHVGVVLRLIITNSESMLLAKSKGSDFYFLPGGGLDYGEDIKEAIARELKEETGMVPRNFEFVGINETKFTENDELHHGIDLVFHVETDKITAESKEDHIDFSLVRFEDLKDLKILPKSLKENVIKWLDDKRTFWGL